MTHAGRCIWLWVEREGPEVNSCRAHDSGDGSYRKGISSELPYNLSLVLHANEEGHVLTWG